MRSNSGYRTAGRRVLVATVASGFLLGLVLASSPQLHSWVHHTGDPRDHACLATTIASGAYDAGATAIALDAPVASPALLRPAGDVADNDSFFLRCRLLQHGPPFVPLA